MKYNVEYYLLDEDLKNKERIIYKEYNITKYRLNKLSNYINVYIIATLEVSK